MAKKKKKTVEVSGETKPITMEGDPVDDVSGSTKKKVRKKRGPNKKREPVVAGGGENSEPTKIPPKSDPKDPNIDKEGFQACFGCGRWCPIESILCHKCGSTILTGEPGEKMPTVVDPEVVNPEVVNPEVSVELLIPHIVWEALDKEAREFRVSVQDLMLQALERGFGELGEDSIDPVKPPIEYDDTEDPEYQDAFESVSGR